MECVICFLKVNRLFTMFYLFMEKYNWIRSLDDTWFMIWEREEPWAKRRSDSSNGSFIGCRCWDSISLSAWCSAILSCTRQSLLLQWPIFWYGWWQNFLSGKYDMRCCLRGTSGGQWQTTWKILWESGISQRKKFCDESKMAGVNLQFPEGYYLKLEL